MLKRAGTITLALICAMTAAGSAHGAVRLGPDVTGPPAGAMFGCTPDCFVAPLTDVSSAGVLLEAYAAASSPRGPFRGRRRTRACALSG